MHDPARSLFPDGLADPPPEAGAYLLMLRLEAPLSGTLRRTPCMLQPGLYAYAGSARGPGGIAARVARHLRADKRPHWHVDALTAAAAHIQPLAFPGGSECALVARLENSGLFTAPLPGFGSSDCRTCRAHLLYWIGGS